jgi:hypothetical protein
MAMQVATYRVGDGPLTTVTTTCWYCGHTETATVPARWPAVFEHCGVRWTILEPGQPPAT